MSCTIDELQAAEMAEMFYKNFELIFYAELFLQNIRTKYYFELKGVVMWKQLI